MNNANGKTGLLLIDVQQDYFEGGAFELDSVQRETAVALAARLLGCARRTRAPVVHVRHETVGSFPPFLRSDTPGMAFHPKVTPLAGEDVITKHAPNGFLGTNLEKVLRARNCEQWLVGGMIAWMCIDSTVRAGAELGLRMALVPEMVASRVLTWREQTFDAATTRAAALAPLSFFAREVGTEEAVNLLASDAT